jgi:hypothetical protein
MSDEQAKDAELCEGPQWGYRRNTARRWWTFWRPRWIRDEVQLAALDNFVMAMTALPLQITRLPPLAETTQTT